MMNNGHHRPHIIIFVVGIATGISIGMLSIDSFQGSYSPVPSQFPDHEAVVDGTLMPMALNRAWMNMQVWYVRVCVCVHVCMYVCGRHSL